MATSDSTPLFTCEVPKSARSFLRRLRLRQQLRLLGTVVVVALLMFFCTAQEPNTNSWTALEVCLVLGGGALTICLVIALVARMSAARDHLFYDDAATLHIGGIFTVTETADSKKLQEIRFFSVSFKGAHFHLILVIYRHLSDVSVGIWQVGGVYPVYFCIQNSDVDRVANWCHERKISVKEEDQPITSP